MPVASEARSGEVERGLRAEIFVVLGKRDRSRATRPEPPSDLRAEGEARNPPLNGIGVEEAVDDAPRIEITFGGESPGDERDEAMEIEDNSRVKTMLSFESLLKLNQ